MEERSLRIYQEKTLFSKISNTITKILTPTKIGINGMLISIKRNNALKAYEAYKASEDIQNQEKQERIAYIQTISAMVQAMGPVVQSGVITKESLNEFIIFVNSYY